MTSAFSIEDKEGLMHNEFKRMQFPEDNFCLKENDNMCATYPDWLIVPCGSTPEQLAQAAQYRALQRLSVVVYRHAPNGAIIARTSQPCVGLFWEANTNDTEYFNALMKSNGSKAKSKPTAS